MGWQAADRQSSDRGLAGWRAAIAAAVCLHIVSAAMAVVTAPVLDIYGETLTTYQATAATTRQGLRPRFDQRGVDIDGTLRYPVPLGWAVAADPLGGGTSAGRMLGDINLNTGTYNPTDVDIALPSLGPPVVIGRTYSHNSRNSSDALYNCGGVVGKNWATTTQPEIVLHEGATDDQDVLYLVYGADRYIEFKRVGTTGADFNTFKAKNGAAGVVLYTAASGSDPDQYLYIDQRGNMITFFGFHANSGVAAGQLWTMMDSAGQMAYIGDDTTPLTAIANGYTSTGAVGRTKVMFDGSGRRYSFSYGTVGGVADLLTGVVVEIDTGGWTEIARVAYDYYTSTDTTNDRGLLGDLKTVTVTHKMGGTDYVRTKYYRYYTRAWADSDGRRGEAHWLKMVVGFDGVRQNSGYASASDSALKPYSEAYFEYADGDSRISAVTFNGNCGCAGGTSGTYELTYEDRTAAPSYTTQIAGNTYNTTWAKRTIIDQPDGTWVTQYFDETGAVRGRVISQGNPASSIGTYWVTYVVRNSSGQVDSILSPENVDTNYTHSSGAASGYGGWGLVTKYVRQTGTTNLNGLCIGRQVLEGTGGTPVTISSITLTDRQLEVGSSGVSVPTVATSVNPVDSGVTTYTYTYWDNTAATNVLFIAPKSIQTAAPAVSTGNNGSNSSVSTYRYLREDGSTAYTKDGTGVLFYTGRSAFGQPAKRIADYDSTTGGYLTGAHIADDSHSAWSLTTTGTGIHAVTEMAYDNLGRPTITTQPSGSAGGTRTSAVVYTIDSGRLGTLSFPRITTGGSTTYYGPASYTRINHAGRPDRRAMIKVSGSIPSLTPSDSDWSGLVDTFYDTSGMRPTHTWTYTLWSTPAYDVSTVGYDSMGRVARTVEATGTITRTAYDERGLVKERWIGTDDAGWTNPAGSGSSSNMVKVETLAYHQNGWLTDRTQDADGNWGTTGDQRHTQTVHDFRGRAVVRLNPVAPHAVMKYDDLNRVTATGLYSASAGVDETVDPTSSATLSGGSTIRVALSTTAYDQRGQVCRTTRFEVDPTDGTTGSTIVADTWYDAGMRPVKVLGPQYVKTIYDRLGRPQDRFILYSTNDSGYGDADDVAGDIVLEQHHTGYDPDSGRAWIQYVVQRHHDDSLTSGTTGALYTGSNPLEVAAASLEGRVQITAMWYDDWDRMDYTAQYGTNGGSNFTRAGSAPSSTDTVLVSRTQFDDFGRAYQTTDAAGIVNRTTFDFAGRRKSTIANHTGGSPGGGTNKDKDLTTEYTYTNGLVTLVKKRVSSSGGDDQDTAYVYGTTLSGGGASQIATGHLLREVILPPQYTSGGGQPTIDRTTATTYNALSEPRTVTDPAGNVIEITYDTGGRAVSRKATTVAGGFDSTVHEIVTTYNTRGMVESVHQENSGNTVLDEVAYEYDMLGNLWTMTADPDSAVGAASARDEFVTTNTYTFYSAGGGNRGLYLSRTTMPFGMGTTDDDVDYTADAIGRVVWMDTGASVGLAEYSYLGAATVVGNSGPFAKNHLISYSSRMDRFNRAIRNVWTGGSDVAFIDLTAMHNRHGRITSVQDDVLRGDSGTTERTFDSVIDYDDLRRAISKYEGEQTSGSITTQSRMETFPRIAAGRIGVDTVSLNSDSDFIDGPLASVDAGEMQDTRTYNHRNELVARSVKDKDHPSTPMAVKLEYDLNGNLTDDGEKNAYTYDAFGRLVKIWDRTSGSPPTVTLAVYTYNGLGQRISERLDTNDDVGSGKGDGLVDGHDQVFYLALNTAGQRVATYRHDDAVAKEVFYRHPAGVHGPLVAAGGLVMRERNADLAADPATWATDPGDWPGLRDQFCTDFEGNVAALVDSAGLVEQYRYSNSGVPHGIPLGDLNGDGEVDATTVDYNIWLAAKTTYDVRADLDLDGDVDADDGAIITAHNGNSTGRGRLSIATIREIYGWRQWEVFGEGLHMVWGLDSEWLSAGLDITITPPANTLPGWLIPIGESPSSATPVGTRCLQLIGAAATTEVCVCCTVATVGAAATCVVTACALGTGAGANAFRRDLLHPGNEPLWVEPGFPIPIRPISIEPPVPLPWPKRIPLDISIPIPNRRIPDPRCTPCSPGTARFDAVPPSTPHFPCAGDHTHISWNTGQGPFPTCKCSYAKGVWCHPAGPWVPDK